MIKVSHIGILLFLAIPPITASITILNRDNKSVGNHKNVLRFAF